MLDHARGLLSCEHDPRHPVPVRVVGAAGSTGAAGPGGGSRGPSDGGPFLGAFVVFLGVPAHLSGYQHYPVVARVISQLHGTDAPGRLHRLLQLELGLGRDTSGAGQVSQYLAQAPGQEQDLLLFQLERDELVGLARLKVKDTLARRA